MEAGEGSERRCSPPGHPRNPIGNSRCLQSTGAVIIGPGGKPLERLAADTPRRHVHYPKKGLVIPRVAEQPQPRHHIADLPPFEELEPAHQLVGHARSPQRDLERPRQGRRSKEHGKVSGHATARSDLRRHLRRNPPGLVLARRIEHDSDAITRGSRRHQPLRLAAGVVGDQAVGRAEDVGGAAIVVLERHNRGGRIVPFKLQDVANARSSPAVDGLVWIACHRKIRVVERQPAENAVLDGVGVLVFVDEDESVAGIERRPEFGIIGQ